MKNIAALLLFTTFWLASPTVMANSCWSGPVSHVSFGDVGPRGGTAVGSISIVCQKTWSPNQQIVYFRACLTMPPGVPITTVNPRGMSNYTGGVVQYDLFSDPAHTSPISTTMSGTLYTKTVLISGSGSPQETITFPVYARVPAGQSAAAGNYQSQNYANIYWVSGRNPPPASACNGAPAISGVYQATTAAWENSCAIIAANDLGFGVHSNLSSASQSQTTVAITCPTGTPWRVSLGQGSHYNGTVRRMKHTSQNSWLSYRLFQNSARTVPWGWTAGVDTRSGTGTGGPEVLSVYGLVPSQTVPASGVYQDNVQVLLTY